jgi:hypothetical protein
VVEYKLNTVTVRLKDTLEANTTYTLEFADAIKDYNEGNILKNFSYRFSTGAYLDSLELGGKVLLAETGGVDTTIIVMLHTSDDDSAVVKEKPRYVARLDRKGNFLFRNLPPKTFYLYALKDEGGTRRYLNEKQVFGFVDSAVTVQAKNQPITIFAYSVPDPPKPPATATTSRNNRNVDGSVTIARGLRYQTTLQGNTQDLLARFAITFDRPLQRFDSTLIHVYTDSLYIPDTGVSFQLDTGLRKVTMQNTWKENREYHIILDKNVAEDSAGTTLAKTDTIHFRTRKLAEYGSLKLKLRNLDITRNPVLQFVVTENVVASFPLTGTELNRSLFLPGEYQLRILYDVNRNGTWDPGDFFGTRRQPEIVVPIERRITMKANWQNEFEIVL